MSMFEGAWPALATPFTARGDVNTEVLRRLVEYLIGKGIGGFYVCGTTGEGVGMTVDERKLVAETVIDQSAGRVPSIIHVGAISVRVNGTLGDEATVNQLAMCLTVAKLHKKRREIKERVFAARAEINAEADQFAADGAHEMALAVRARPTPAYPGRAHDDAWLRRYCGYGL